MTNEIHAQVDKIATEVVAKEAARIDRDGVFPEAAIAALAQAGALGLVSAGGGGGLRDAVRVVERLARECASTAMVM